MPHSDDEVEARLAILEREVARLREQALLASSDAAAARVLAAGADRDVSEVRAELRAHIQVLNALRETQLEQAQEMREGFTEMREGFTEIRGELTEMREGFTEIRGELTEMREGFTKQAIGMAEITVLLTKIAGPEGHD